MRSKNTVSGMKNQFGFFISQNPIKIDNLPARLSGKVEGGLILVMLIKKISGLSGWTYSS